MIHYASDTHLTACHVEGSVVTSTDLREVTCAACRKAACYLQEEPPMRSVVAIDWGGGGTGHQEVWVANSSNIGNWYTPDIPLRGDAHPHWEDVLRRAEGRTLTLLTAGDTGEYAAGYDAGVSAAAAAVEQALDEARYCRTGSDPLA